MLIIEANSHIADDWHIVGAGDVDGYILGVCAAVGVVDGDGEHSDDRLVGGEEVEVGLADRVVPVDGAVVDIARVGTDGEGILDREDDMGIKGRVKAGPADASIYDEQNNVCIAKDMKKKGVKFQPADKSAGSRKQGWEQIRKLMKGAVPVAEGLPREKKGLFVTANCLQFLITVPSLSRSDKDPDDVNTEAEDHIADETRYRCRAKLRGGVSQEDF